MILTAMYLGFNAAVLVALGLVHSQPKSEFPRSTRWKIDQLKKRATIRRQNKIYERYSSPRGVRRLSHIERNIKRMEKECAQVDE